MKSKWMIGLVPALLAFAPLANAEDASDTSNGVAAAAADQGTAAPEACAVDPTAEKQIQDLNAQVDALRAALVRQSEDGPTYLDQTDRLWP